MHCLSITCSSAAAPLPVAEISRRAIISLLPVVVALLACTASAVDIAEPNYQERVTVAGQYTLDFVGGVRLRAGTFGDSRIAWNPGPMAISDDGGSLWVAGHAQHYSIARFELPAPVYSSHVEDYPIAEVSDPFVKIAPPDVEGRAPDRITGIEQVRHALVVNVAQYYDGAARNRQTSIVFDDAWNLNSTQRGYFRMQGAVHAAGWMSRVPLALQPVFGAPYLTGHASNLPINARSSIGPSLFVWAPARLLNPSLQVGEVFSRPLIDYPLDNPLRGDLRNESGENKLWTELSTAAYGFFTPGNTHYLVVGRSGGHETGVGYKITQENGRRCGGFCANDYRDVANYFWMYALEEILAAQCESREPYEVRPAEYGALPVFALGRQIAGADYHRASGNLYLLINGADDIQNRFERQPVLLVYKLGAAPSNDLRAESGRVEVDRLLAEPCSTPAETSVTPNISLPSNLQRPGSISIAPPRLGFSPGPNVRNVERQ